MDLSRLDEPFAADDIEWRAQRCGENNGKIWVSVLAYVTNRAIMSRLDAVCGKGNWKNEFKDSGKAVECGISIKIDGEWVTKWDAAEETNVEAVKGGRSGAMKRAAVQWGIGRYLYNLDAGWGVVSPGGAHSGKTKSGQWFKWDPPQLPSWALPHDPNLDLIREAVSKGDCEFVKENWDSVVKSVWGNLNPQQKAKLSKMRGKKDNG